MKPIVYFSSKINHAEILKIYQQLGFAPTGNLAIKVHSGEPGNQNFLKPEMWATLIKETGGTVVECNTAYDGGRNTTEKHVKTLKAHGWSDAFDVEILDAEGPDLALPINNGRVIKKNFVGRGVEKYDSALILSHFKGHPMGGFGGAIKQLSIGFASSYGKAYIHGVGVPENFWTSDHDDFLRAMADAASSVVDYFGGRIAYINVMANMSVDCDCCAKAEDPCMKDIGILASLDPVALDRACLDLIYASQDKGRDHLVERIESRNGTLTVDAAEALGIGSTDYTLINID